MPASYEETVIQGRIDILGRQVVGTTTDIAAEVREAYEKAASKRGKIVASLVIPTGNEHTVSGDVILITEYPDWPAYPVQDPEGQSVNEPSPEEAVQDRQ